MSRPAIATALLLALLVGLTIAQHPVAAFLMLVGATLTLAVVGRPDTVTVLVTLLFYLNAPAVAVTSHGAPATISRAFIGLLVFPLCSAVLRRAPLVIPAPFILLLLYLLARTASTLASAYPVDAAEQTVELLFEGVILYFLIVNVVRTTDSLRLVAWAVVVAGALLGAVTIFQWITGTYDRPYGGFGLIPIEYLSGFAESPRASGPIGDPNYYAQVMLVPTILAMFVLRIERNLWLRIGLIGSLVLLIGGLLLTFSRGAGVAVVLTLLVMFAVREVSVRHLAFVLLVGAVALVAVPQYRERITSVTSAFGATAEAGTSEAEDQSIRSRSTEMRAATYVFADHPVFGVGAGLFPQYYQEYAGRIGTDVHEEVRFGAERGEIPQREAHNMFLGVAAETGIFGLLTLAGVLFVTLRSLLKARKWARTSNPDLALLATGFFAAIVAYVCAGLFLSLAYERYLWFVLALAAVPGVIAAEQTLAASRVERSSSSSSGSA